MVAHELGHVRYRDVPHGLLLAGARRAVRDARGRARWRSGWRRRRGRRCRRVALLVARSSPAVTMVSNQLSRGGRGARRRFSLALTHEPDALIGFERRITRQNVGDPDPPAG